MVWIAKAGAPAAFSLSQAFLADIVGNASLDWLAPWVPLIPPATYDTAAFCAMGPRPAPPVTAADFVDAIGGSGNIFQGAALNGSLLGALLRNVALDNLFAAYCEDGGTTGALVCRRIGGPYTFSEANGRTVVPDRTPIPAGTTWVVQELEHDGENGAINAYGFVSGVPGGNLLAGTARSAGDGEGGSYFTAFHREYAWDGSRWTDGFGSSPSIDVPEGPVWYLWACGPGSDGTPVPYSATPQSEPDGVIPPASKTYGTIADLGAELDAQELKLDYILAAVSAVAAQVVAVSGAAGPVTAIVSGEVIDLSAAAGLIVSTVPGPGADIEFGAPARTRRVGKIIFGGADGYGPIVDIDVSPKVMNPLPAPLQTSAVIELETGASGSYRVIPLVAPI